MAWLRIESVESPLDRPEVAAILAATLRHADAMGLLPEQPARVARLDVDRLVELLRRVREAGIARQPIADLASGPASPRRVAALLARVNDALLESPSPVEEWSRGEEVLGADLLSRLVGVSESSLKRYRQGERATPDDVAARLHFLALVVSDLAGAYNDVGVRRWFDRPRAQLGGKPPASVLRGEWGPRDAGASQVRALAEALTASPAT